MDKRSIAARSRRLFGPPPLLGKKGAAHYDELLVHMFNAVRPADFIEEIWLRDIVDLTWEILRWRRIKTKVLAKVKWLSFERVERLDRLTMIAEGRRKDVLRYIDRRRAAFAQTLRYRTAEIEDAAFQTIEPKSITSNNATTEAQHDQRAKNHS